MARVLINESNLTDIADAIRGKNGTQNTYTPSQMASAISAISTGLNIKKFTATLSADSTGDLILITDDYFKTVRNDPNGFVLMRYLGAVASTAEMVFWFGSNMTIAYGGATAYNMLAVRQTTSNAVGIYNTRGLVGDNYNGHINITANGGLRFINSASYPMKAGTYEILAGIWPDDSGGYTNLILLSEEVSSSAVFNNGLGYKNGYYMSGDNQTANASDCMTGCIPYVIATSAGQPTDVLYIKGYTGGTSESHTRLQGRNSSKVGVTTFNGFLNSNGFFDVETLGSGYYKLTPKANVHNSYADIAWLQFSFHQSDASVIIITKNEPIE